MTYVKMKFSDQHFGDWKKDEVGYLCGFNGHLAALVLGDKIVFAPINVLQVISEKIFNNEYYE